MTTAFLIALTCVVIGGIIVAVARKRRNNHVARTAPSTQTPTDPYAQTFSGGNPEDIKVGDLIGGLFDMVHGDTLRSVRGSVTLQDGNYQWKEHFLESSGDTQYLSVEREKGTVVTALWTNITSIPTVTPGDSAFVYAGVGYELDEEGRAIYSTVGATDDLLTNGTARYFDYKGTDGSRISFEQFDGSQWECSHGEVVTNLIIYPKP